MACENMELRISDSPIWIPGIRFCPTQATNRISILILEPRSKNKLRERGTISRRHSLSRRICEMLAGGISEQSQRELRFVRKQIHQIFGRQCQHRAIGNATAGRRMTDSCQARPEIQCRLAEQGFLRAFKGSLS